MSNQKSQTRKLLSSDLSGFGKYLKGIGLGERQISFSMLAPRRLIELFGCLSGLEFLKDCEFKSKFLGFIQDQYKPGQLKKYAAGITHYRAYLVSIKTLVLDSPQLLKFSRIKVDSEVDLYNKNCGSYFKGIESEYLKHITIEMEYSEREIAKKVRAYKKFAWFLTNRRIDSLVVISAEDILKFNKLESTRKTDWNLLRGFLIFAYRQGYTRENLSPAIIRVKKKTKRKKQYLKVDEIERLLSSVCRSSIDGKRTFAVFLLMARLGLRPIEPTRMKLKDVDWANSRIFIRGKNKKNDWMPMPQDVAEAIMDYLKAAPRGDTDQLFVQLRPPHGGFERTYVFSKALRKAYQKSGICPPTGNVRLNVFRHSFATKLLNSDNKNIFAVQSLLRHSTPSMTLHYAKYHSKKLSLFQIKWPEAKT